MNVIAKKTNITFIRVPNNAAKAACICQVIQHHFSQGESVLVAVPNMEAAEYIDQLLWRRPEESFLPHAVVQGVTKEVVAITTKKDNLNGAKVLFNLCPDVSPIVGEFEIVYELHDETQADKLQLSQQRRGVYAAAGYEIKDQK